MIRRWGHLHTWATGLCAGVVLSGHVWIAMLGALAVGLVAGRVWGTWVFYSAAIREKVLHARRERISTKPMPVYSTRRRSRQNESGVPF